MATLRANTNPKSRRETGDDVLSRAKSVNTTAVKAKLAAFAKVHAAFGKADAAVQVADRAASVQQAKVGDADASHDALVEELASAAVGEGASRRTPFASWKAPAPSELRDGAAAASAKASKKLAAAIAKDKAAGSKTKAAAAKLDKAASAVLAALEPAAAAVEKRRRAIAERDALEAAWEKAFAVLKRGARAAADDAQSAGVFEALFALSAAASAKKTSKKGSAKAAAPAAPSGVGGDVAG